MDGAARLRVLVVEDDADTAETTAYLLTAAGHSARVARDGAAALRDVQADLLDVVLLDLAMPKMDGYEVARRIRAMGFNPRPLLVAVTGYGTAPDRQRTDRAGFDAHLLKPADPELLLQLLARFSMTLRPPALTSAPRRTRPGAGTDGAGLLDLSDRLRADSIAERARRAGERLEWLRVLNRTRELLGLHRLSESPAAPAVAPRPDREWLRRRCQELAVEVRATSEAAGRAISTACRLRAAGVRRGGLTRAQDEGQLVKPPVA
jgi:CheY-like chemotaxis protein